MKAEQIKTELKRLKLGEIRRYEGVSGAVFVRKSTGGVIIVDFAECTLDAIADLVSSVFSVEIPE